MTLPSPSLVQKVHKTEQIADKEHFGVLIEQRIPSDLVDRILNLTSDPRINLNLDRLDVVVCSHSNNELFGRLPIWDGIVLARWPDRIIAFREILALLARHVAGRSSGAAKRTKPRGQHVRPRR